MTALMYPIIVFVLFLLAKIFPYKKTDEGVKVDFETLKRKYQKWDLFPVLLIFILIPAITYLIGSLFSRARCSRQQWEIHGHNLTIPGNFGSGHQGIHIPYNEIPIFIRP